MSALLAAFDGLAPLLGRAPDVEAHDLVAADRSDRLILAEVEPLLGGADEVVVIGDRYGALTLPILLADPGIRVRLHQDPITSELALARNAEEAGVSLERVSWHGLDAGLAEGARVVIAQLPRGLDALDEIAGVVAGAADPAVRLLAGGRVKHMTPSMNETLAVHFGEVRASRGVGKSRALHASAPIARPSTWPRSRRHEDIGVTLAAHGAAFAGTDLDIGTRFLLAHLPDMPHAEYVIDLGCGTGAIAAAYALARPGSRVTATDRSAAAADSARETMRLNGVADHVKVARDDGLASRADASADLVLLNPPFHSGNAVTEGIAPRLFADAARVLRPGGELWTVWNSHLRYRPALERLVGETRQVDRDRTFTVTASTRR
ncbi:class I SAM-dependent methyltransferase [Microbacterium indicum]|uniref:class I SAM-dependent methyltransferase n=1 Tax=Microbacterium indicum TaxID=358100 RepID=UPI00040FCCB0|nr:methyltransferase [Microbacterium indicum]